MDMVPLIEVGFGESEDATLLESRGNYVRELRSIEEREWPGGDV